MDAHRTAYEELLEKDLAVRSLLQTLPWVLDGSVQQVEPFRRTLQNEAARLAELDAQPCFSLVTPLWNTPPRYLEELIASCRLQTWPHWELLLVDDASTTTEHLELAAPWAERDPRIKLIRSKTNLGISGARNLAIASATGAYVGILDHDDILHPQALGLYARILRRHRDVNFLYSNEVKVNEASDKLSEFYIKPDFDLATLRRSNYICHFTVMARELLDRACPASGTWFLSSCDGVEDHELFLRLAELPGFTPYHVPLYTYYWRKTAGSTVENLDEKPYVYERGLKMLAEHLGDRLPTGSGALVAKGGRSGNLFFSIHLCPKPGRKLAVLIPYKDQVHLTLRCLQALEAQVHELDVTVVLIDNGSCDPKTPAAMSAFIQQEEMAGNRPRPRYITLSHPGAFNYARINNQAVAALPEAPDLLLLLNNDVELLSPHALQTLAGELEHHATTAFVGLKLWYPGKEGVQHGGIKVMPPLSGLGFHRTAHSLGGREYVDDEHVVHAVSFACAMVRYGVWQELGGLEEEFFPNGFGDMDICTRAVQRGYVNFYMGTLEGIHHESKTRKAQSEELEASMLSMLYGSELAHARRVQLGYDLHLPWTLQGGGSSHWFEMHLRYRIADRLNELFKKLGAPLHKSLKRLLKRRSLIHK